MRQPHFARLAVRGKMKNHPAIDLRLKFKQFANSCGSGRP